MTFTSILKDLREFLAPIFTTLFNKAIAENQYPNSLKLTKVIELFKKEDRSNPSKYRPISLLPIIAKVLDKIINTQVMIHMLKHKILSATQYAYRPKSSTSMALQTVINRIHTNATKRLPVLAIYLDLSKAFDTGSHDKLLHKLQHNFNFTPGALNFFKSYLHNRQQSTHTQHAQSTFRTITYGIPQGSCLSPTLFILYINDIIHSVTHSKVYTYADDTTLIISTEDMTTLQTLAQTELSSLISYFHHNNLVPNAKKTFYTIFHPKTAEVILEIGDVTLQHKKSTRLLGVMVQQNRKMDETVAITVKKMQPVVYSFTYANKFLSTEWMRRLYFTHIYPHFLHAFSVWGTDNPRATYIQPLIKLQKKVVRILFRAHPRTPTKPLMHKLQILNITNLYIYRVCLETHPYIYTTDNIT